MKAAQAGASAHHGQPGEKRLDTFSASYLAEAAVLLGEIDCEEVEAVARGLRRTRDSAGRLFILGVGGSAGHAGHAVNDFRKICGFEAYSPTDNVSELTARTNDEGWDSCFAEWLRGCRLRRQDALLVFSVGGGDRERSISVNIVNAIELANAVGAKVYGVVGRRGGYTREAAAASVLIPPLFEQRITPHTEGLCAVVWHLLVSHPALKTSETKWESAAGARL